MAKYGRFHCSYLLAIAQAKSLSSKRTWPMELRKMLPKMERLWSRNLVHFLTKIPWMTCKSWSPGRKMSPAVNFINTMVHRCDSYSAMQRDWATRISRKFGCRMRVDSKMDKFAMDSVTTHGWRISSRIPRPLPIGTNISTDVGGTIWIWERKCGFLGDFCAKCVRIFEFCDAVFRLPNRIQYVTQIFHGLPKCLIHRNQLG